ncbi:MAG: DUF4124 domain-containing protein [Ottowia sp.]|nr:DUF4124 domain-containing protein [Ottowia sp.]
MPRARFSRLTLRAAALALAALCVAGGVQAQQKGGALGGIYTCTDQYGRKLTSDRPIPECQDREQRELNRSGSTRRVVPPSMSAVEQQKAAQRQREEKRQAEIARSQQRLDQALVARYPDKAAHDAGRRDALQQSQIIIDGARLNLASLQAERQRMDEEMEFYKKDPSKTPPALRRALEKNQRDMEQQELAINNQTGEQARINAAFDEELARLQQLWAQRAARTQ